MVSINSIVLLIAPDPLRWLFSNQERNTNCPVFLRAYVLPCINHQKYLEERLYSVHCTAFRAN